MPALHTRPFLLSASSTWLAPPLCSASLLLCHLLPACPCPDVLSVSGFMLEGTASGPELAALSLPSSPRYGNASANLNSRQSSWFQPSRVPSVANSRPVTPHAGTVGSLSRLAWAASAAPLAGSSGSLPSQELLVACMPPPAWPAPANAVPTADGGRTEPQLEGGSGDGLLVDQPAAPTGAGKHGANATQQNGRAHACEQQHCEQGEQLEGEEANWAEQLREQAPALSGSPGAPYAEPSLQAGSAARHSSTVSLSMWRVPGCASDTPSSKAVFTAWQSPASPFRQPTDGSPAAEPAVPMQLAVDDGASGSVTPRLASLASLGPAANSLPLPEGLLQVTPRQHSLLGCSPRVQVGWLCHTRVHTCARQAWSGGGTLCLPHLPHQPRLPRGPSCLPPLPALGPRRVGCRAHTLDLLPPTGVPAGGEPAQHRRAWQRASACGGAARAGGGRVRRRQRRRARQRRPHLPELPPGLVQLGGGLRLAREAEM